MFAEFVKTSIKNILYTCYMMCFDNDKTCKDKINNKIDENKIDIDKEWNLVD